MLTRFTILGERCSGTNWIANLMSNNFRISNVSPLGWKHFVHTHAAPQRLLNSLLVVLVVRNPIDWINSFHRQPFHVPHPDYAPGLDHFVRHSPWRSFSHIDGRTFNFRSPDPAQLGKELDFDCEGKHFEHLLDMRTRKLREWLKLKAVAPFFVVASYDQVLSDPGSFLEEMQMRFGLERLDADRWNHSESYKTPQTGRRLDQEAHLAKQFYTTIEQLTSEELLGALGRHGWNKELCSFVVEHLDIDLESELNLHYGLMLLRIREISKLP